MNTRQIKFRGKRVDNGEWVYGYLFVNYYNVHTIVSHQFGRVTNDVYEVIPESVGQYCGLKDKNNKEIFEGDLVSHKFYKTPVLVEWKGCGFEFGDISPYSDRIEVIGNIYEHKHLLEEKTKTA